MMYAIRFGMAIQRPVFPANTTTEQKKALLRTYAEDVASGIKPAFPFRWLKRVFVKPRPRVFLTAEGAAKRRLKSAALGVAEPLPEEALFVTGRRDLRLIHKIIRLRGQEFNLNRHGESFFLDPQRRRRARLERLELELSRRTEIVHLKLAE